MILDNVNPNDLFPTESKGPSVLGVIEYNVQGQSEFEGAFIATSERLIMNVDIVFTFNIGKVPMKQIKTKDVKAFVDYVESKIK